MQGDIELTTEAQQLRAAENRLREMKANPWSEYNSHHCVMDGFEMKTYENYFFGCPHV